MVIKILLIVAIGIMTIGPGIYLTLNKNHWVMNHAKNVKEPHPLGPALIFLGMFFVYIAMLDY